MAKKKETGNHFTDWGNVIRQMKVKVELYYRKDDTERKQPFKVSGVRTHFKSGETMVDFYSIRTDEPISYALEKDQFIQLFELVQDED